MLSCVITHTSISRRGYQSEVNFCPPSTCEFQVNLKAGRAGFTHEIRKKRKRKRKMTYWEKLKKSCHLLQLHSQQFGMIRNWKVDVFKFLSKCQTLVNFSGPWKVNRKPDCASGRGAEWGPSWLRLNAPCMCEYNRLVGQKMVPWIIV